MRRVKYKGEPTSYGLEQDEIYEVISIENDFTSCATNQMVLYSKNFLK